MKVREFEAKDWEQAYEKMKAERDRIAEAFFRQGVENARYRAALESMLTHVCDGGGDKPCSQMWFQDVAEEALFPDDTRLDINVQPETSTKADG